MTHAFAVFMCFLCAISIASAETKEFVANGGFENGTESWTVAAAADHARVDVIEDASAPDGKQVICFDHRRTRNSSISQRVRLEPYSLYIVSYWIKAEEYHRTGVGFQIDVSADGQTMGDRFWEHQLSEDWQIKRLAFSTAAGGDASVTFSLSSAVGRVCLDNVRITQVTQQEARQILGSCPMIMEIPPRPNEARAKVLYDEIPIADRIISHITLRVNVNLPENIWKESGRVHLELPPEVQLHRSAGQQENIGDGYVRHTFASSEFANYGGPFHFMNAFLSPHDSEISGRKARLWAEWKGGKQEPVEVECVFVKIPVVSQPKTIMTDITCYGETPKWYPDYFAMMKSLGFNTIDAWGLGSEYIEPLRAQGFDVALVHSGFSDLESRLESVEAAQAVGLDGEPRKNVIEPAHRGKLFEDLMSDMDKIASRGFSAVFFDDEHYRDWASMNIGATDEAKQRWTQWLAKNRPGLEPIMPEVFLDDPLGHMEQYQAWWMFRSELVAEWYAAAREQFERSVKQHNAQSTRQLWIGSYTGPAEFSQIKSSFLNPSDMVGIWDRIAPMYYESAEEIRRDIKNLVRAIGREHAYAALCMGEGRADRWEWRPGEIKPQLLEVLFAGGMGYTCWSWPYSNLRIMSEVIATNGIVADNEEIFLNGKSSDRFWTEQDRCFTTTLETESAGLLLVSNYTTTNNKTIWVRKRPEKPMQLTELYTGQVLRLADQQQIVSVEISPQNCQLWKWDKP